LSSNAAIWVSKVKGKQAKKGAAKWGATGHRTDPPFIWIRVGISGKRDTKGL